MNKLKVLYDVIKAMKDQEAFNGTITLQVRKDAAQILFLQNEFEKNLTTGQTKAKINTEFDCDGNTMNHESNPEFKIPNWGAHGDHRFLNHMHHHGFCRESLKGRLSRLAFAFSLLMALEIEEQEDKRLIITLNAKDLTDDAKALLSEMLNRPHTFPHHGHGFLKHFTGLENPDFALTISVNNNYQVDKAVITLTGTQNDEHNAPHDMTILAELSLTR